MPFRRPGAATAAGVLAIIYGSLFSLCGLCGLVGLAAQGAGHNFMAGNDPMQIQLQQELQQALERDVPGYQAIEIVGAIVGLGGALLLLSAGIGIFYMRRWARTLALVDCLVLIAVTLFKAVFQATMVMPAAARAFEVALPAAIPQGGAMPPAEFLRAMQTFMTVMLVGAVVLYVVAIVYLFIIVFLLSRRDVRLAFADPRQQGFDERPFEDERHASGAEDDDDWENRRPPRDDWRDR